MLYLNKHDAGLPSYAKPRRECLVEARKLMTATISRRVKQKDKAAIAVIVTADDAPTVKLLRTYIEELFLYPRRFFTQVRTGEPVWWLWREGRIPHPVTWEHNENKMLFSEIYPEYVYPWGCIISR